MRADDIPQPNYDPLRSYAITGRTLNAILRALAKRTPKPGDNIRIQEDLDGFSIHARAADGTACAFGQIDPQTSGTPPVTTFYLTAGLIQAGPAQYLPDPFALPTSTDGTYHVWLEIDVTANKQDGLLLPGLASSSPPTWGSGTAIPDATIPTTPSGNGTAIIPVATITVTNGIPTAVPMACGPLAITHCPGTLSAATYL